MNAVTADGAETETNDQMKMPKQDNNQSRNEENEATESAISKGKEQRSGRSIPGASNTMHVHNFF